MSVLTLTNETFIIIASSDEDSAHLHYNSGGKQISADFFEVADEGVINLTDSAGAQTSIVLSDPNWRWVKSMRSVVNAFYHEHKHPVT